jgi:hypothetical protein
MAALAAVPLTKVPAALTVPTSMKLACITVMDAPRRREH